MNQSDLSAYAYSADLLSTNLLSLHGTGEQSAVNDLSRFINDCVGYLVAHLIAVIMCCCAAAIFNSCSGSLGSRAAQASAISSALLPVAQITNM